MLWMTLGAIGIAGIVLVYRSVRPMTGPHKKLDAGAVSEYWIEQHRGRPQDASR